MPFKLSNLNANLPLTLGYLNPALNNLAQLFLQIKSRRILDILWVFLKYPPTFFKFIGVTFLSWETARIFHRGSKDVSKAFWRVPSNMNMATGRKTTSSSVTFLTKMREFRESPSFTWTYLFPHARGSS